MKPVTNEQEFLKYQIERLVEQQEKTNELLKEFLTKKNETTKKRVTKKEVE